MELHYREVGQHSVAEAVSDVMIDSTQEAVDLIATAAYRGASHLILREKNFPAAFFDLKSGMAGEIFQKFTNHRMNLVIVGNFDEVESESLRALILESNRGRTIRFVPDIEAALASIAAR